MPSCGSVRGFGLWEMRLGITTRKMDGISPPRYRESAPPPALAPWLECTWTLRGRTRPGGARERLVLPDGCMDVIFDLSAPAGHEDAAFVVGTMTRALPVADAPETHLVGLRFHPGAAPAFLELAAHEMVDAREPLAAFWGAEAGIVRERVEETGPGVLEAVLHARLARARRDDPRVRAAVRMIGRSAGVGEVARRLGLGRRQLERRFGEAVGVPPSVLARILRFRRAAELLAGPLPLSRVALEAGYHDQPHMNRDFRAFAGVSPGAYRRLSAPPLETIAGAAVDDASVQDDLRAAR